LFVSFCFIHLTLLHSTRATQKTAGNILRTIGSAGEYSPGKQKDAQNLRVVQLRYGRKAPGTTMQQWFVLIGMMPSGSATSHAPFLKEHERTAPDELIHFRMARGFNCMNRS